jgi:predicted secreted Zn-dependent protease
MPATYIAHIPRWTSPRRVPTYMAWWWRKDAARTGWHEAQHVKISKRYQRQLRARVRGIPCERFGAVARRWSRSLARAQAAFDRRDYPRGAAASQRWWREAYERFPPGG